MKHVQGHRGGARPAGRRFHPLRIVAALASAGMLIPAHALDRTWFGGTGDWALADHWSPLGAPLGGDRAIIGAGSASLSFAAGVAGLTMTGGRLAGSGVLTVNGDATLTGGEQTSTGTSQFNGNVGISGNGSRGLSDGRVMNTAATTTWEGNTANGGNAILITRNATINNSGTWNDANRFDASMGNGPFPGIKVYNNTGTYNKTGNTVTDIAMAVNNSGTINVSAGRLSLNGATGGTSTGSFQIAAGSILSFGRGGANEGLATLDGAKFSGTGALLIDASNDFGAGARLIGSSSHSGMLSILNGKLQVDGNFTVPTFNQTGGRLAGSGTLTVNGAATLTGGEQTSTGTSQFNGNVGISGNGSRGLSDGRVMNTTATTTWEGNTANGGNAILITRNSTINNSGTWNDANRFDASMGNGPFPGIKVFNNTGTYNKTGNTFTDIAMAVNNSGTINVGAGRLSLNGATGGTSTGSFQIAAGSILSFGRGRVGVGLATLDGAKFSGTGALLIDASNDFGAGARLIGSSSHSGMLSILNGKLQVDGNFTVPTFNQTGGRLAGSGTLTVNGAATLTGGEQTGTGTSQFNGDVAITGNTSRVVGSSRVMNTTAITTWEGNTAATGNSIFVNSSATFNNTGTWNDKNAFNSKLGYPNSGGNGTVIFNNAGVYNKSGNAITDMAATFNNTGTVNVQNGLLRINGAVESRGVANVSAGATLRVDGAFTNSGLLQGYGTLQLASGQSLMNNGIISPGNSIGHLTLDGDLKSGSSGSLKFELTSLASFDQLTVTDDVKLGGKIDVWNLGYRPVVGDSFVVMTFDQRLGNSTFVSLASHDFGTGTRFDVIYNDHNVTLRVTAVPEPETYTLMLAGLGVIGAALRRRRPA